MTEVLIVGAGPAGLLLAAELRLAGVDTVVIERHLRRPDFCRGFNLNARALDLLARRGLAGRLIGEGRQVPHAAFSGLPVASPARAPAIRTRWASRSLVQIQGHVADLPAASCAVHRTPSGSPLHDRVV